MKLQLWHLCVTNSERCVNPRGILPPLHWRHGRSATGSVPSWRRQVPGLFRETALFAGLLFFGRDRARGCPNLVPACASVSVGRGCADCTLLINSWPLPTFEGKIEALLQLGPGGRPNKSYVQTRDARSGRGVIHIHFPTHRLSVFT